MIDIEQIKLKLIEKFRSSGWVDPLKGFILSSDFDNIIKDLEKQVDDNKRFTPQLKNVFTAFEECKWEHLKVVMLGQDPYPQIGVACGVAFDCRNTGKEQPSLRYLRDSIQRTVYDPIPEPRNTDLSYLSSQGVLMINTALTTQIDAPLTHQKIWQAFIAYVLDTIASNKKDIIFIFMGKTAQHMGDLVYDKYDKPETGHYKFDLSHPAAAAYNKAEQWDCKDIFHETNKLLELHGKTKINW